MTNREIFLRAFEEEGGPLGIFLPGDVDASIGQTKEGKWRIVYETDPMGKLEGKVLEADTPEELAFDIIMSALSLMRPHYKGQYEHWQWKEEEEDDEE